MPNTVASVQNPERLKRFPMIEDVRQRAIARLPDAIRGFLECGGDIIVDILTDELLNNLQLLRIESTSSLQQSVSNSSSQRNYHNQLPTRTKGLQK